MAADQTETLADAVRRAAAERQPVTVLGSGSKTFLLPERARRSAALLSAAEHEGIVDYRADELVLTARAGTPLPVLEQTLARENQMLPFEPPAFHGPGTLGGAVAAGLSGPARPWWGSVRDAVLGVKVINGLGDVLSFGGRVVKNVAGYDVARLQTGAFGTLGLLLEVSVRVVPRPACEETRVFSMTAADAVATMRAWSRQPLPLAGMCHLQDQLRVRLAGSEAAVLAAGRRLGGDVLGDAAFWRRLAGHELPFFRTSGSALFLQRVAPAMPPPEPWDGLIDWAGARRWLHVVESATPANGVRFDSGYARAVCQAASASAPLGEYQRRVRAAFDPHGLFNPELGDADVAA